MKTKARVAPVVSPLTPNYRDLPVGTPLHRIFDRTFPATSFNPGRGRPSRFAPIFDASGLPIPTCYVGESLECAMHERVFHDVPLEGRFRTIAFSALNRLAHVELAASRSLRLATLFAPDLARWGIERSELIDTPSSTYMESARWAEALYRESPALDGLMWTSRRCDPDCSYLLFGGRVQVDDLQITQAPREIARDPDLLEQLVQFVRRTGIVLTEVPTSLPAPGAGP